MTIGISTYNAEAHVERAIASALAQTWAPIEILIVDDRSTDGTREILERINAARLEIRVIYQHVNLGVAAVINRIIDAAKGEYIAFFDDDDASDPERVHKQVERLVAYEHEHEEAPLVLCYCNRTYILPKADCQPSVIHAIGRRPPEPHGLAVVDWMLKYALDPSMA